MNEPLRDRLSKLDKFRFYVADENGRRWSDIWFVGAHSGSVYMASRKLGGSLKLSLHPRGQSDDGLDCQFGHPSSFAAKQKAQGFRPIPLLRWGRKALREREILQVARVLFPTAYLAPMEASEADGKLKFALPVAPTGQALELSIMCSREEPKEFEDSAIARGFTPFVYTGLEGGEFASIMARHVEFNGSPLQDLSQRSRSVQPLSGICAPGQTIENARALIVGGSPESGEALSLIEAGPLQFSYAA